MPDLAGPEHEHSCDGSSGECPETTRRIRPLATEVINRIAAGEVVARPSSALKELLENAIDAGSTRVSITAVLGGLSRLEVVDNGCGISAEDAPLVCQRHTTSKLRTVSDLSSVATCGFRGEALASISYVAQVRITSRAAQEEFAWTANYLDGVLTGSGVRPAARTTGTTVIVSDMFRSARSKHESFVRSQAEEYRQILSIAARYAIFHSGRIAMSCRKREHSDSRAFETGTADLCTHANATHLENIQGIFGRQLVSGLGQVSRTHLHRVHCPLLGPDRSAEVVLERAFFSRLGASQSKATHIYFLNGRLVACRMLRKAIEQLYAKYYLKGPHYPFCYVELCMAPEILDINVHPTKKEVRFLDEQIVFRSIVDILERELIQSGEQQSFVVQVNPMLDARSVSTTFKRRASSTTPEEGAVATAQTSEVSSGRKRSVNEDSFMTSGAHQGNVDGDDHKPSGSRLNEELADGWIRLCSEQQERRLSQRFSTQTVPASQRIRVDAHILKLERWHDLNCATSERLHPSKMTMLSTQLPNTEAVRDNPSNTSAPASTGILDLLMLECSDAQSLPIAEVFRQHVFVGAVDERFCLIQFGTALVAVDMLHVLGCFYYQLLLEILQQRSEPTPAIRLRPSWVVETSACDSMTPNPSPTAIPDWASYAGELYRYCGIHLCPHPLCSVMDQLDATKLGTVPPDCWPRTTTGICLYLHSLPWLNLPGACTPCVSALNTFAEELVSARSHTNLCGRIRQVVHGVAGLYANSFVASFTERSRTENPHGTLAGAAERALLLVRDHQSFSPPEKWARDGTLTVVARTERLYRIFERC